MKLIVAVDQDNAIGWANGELPWRSSRDMARFKELTMGDSVVMGRNTWNSLPEKVKPLPGRTNYVLTSTELAGQEAKIIAQLSQAPVNAWVIGGAQLYDYVLRAGLVIELYITQVHLSSGADVRIAHNLYDFRSFIADELTRGRVWELEDICVPTVPLSAGPGISFINLVRVK